MWMQCCGRPPPPEAVAASRQSGEKQTLLDGGALDSRAPVDIYTWRTSGYLLQYFAVGLVYGFVPACNYPLFVCYLNAPAYVAAAAATLASFPWALKIFFAFF